MLNEYLDNVGTVAVKKEKMAEEKKEKDEKAKKEGENIGELLPNGQRVLLSKAIPSGPSSPIEVGTSGSISYRNKNILYVLWDGEETSLEVRHPLKYLKCDENIQLRGIEGHWRYSILGKKDTIGSFEIMAGRGGVFYNEEDSITQMTFDPNGCWFKVKMGSCVITVRRHEKQSGRHATQLEMVVSDEGSNKSMDAKAVRPDPSPLCGIWMYGDNNYFIIEKHIDVFKFAEVRPNRDRIVGEIFAKGTNKEWEVELINVTQKNSKVGFLKMELVGSDILRTHFKELKNRGWDEPMDTFRVAEGTKSPCGTWYYGVSDFSIATKPNGGYLQFREVHPDGVVVTGILTRDKKFWEGSLQAKNGNKFGYIRLRVLEKNRLQSQFRENLNEQWDGTILSKRKSELMDSITKQVIMQRPEKDRPKSARRSLNDSTGSRTSEKKQKSIFDSGKPAVETETRKKSKGSSKLPEPNGKAVPPPLSSEESEDSLEGVNPVFSIFWRNSPSSNPTEAEKKTMEKKKEPDDSEYWASSPPPSEKLKTETVDPKELDFSPEARPGSSVIGLKSDSKVKENANKPGYSIKHQPNPDRQIFRSRYG